MSNHPRLRKPTAYVEASAMVRGADLAARLWHRAPEVVAAARGILLRRRARAKFASRPRPYRFCLGSGQAPIEGWTNVDYYFPADVQLDLRYGLPVADDSTQFIYSEHLIEHLPLEVNLRLFEECRRVLKPGGRIRIATPDLAAIVADYRTAWRRHDWVNWDEYSWIDSGTRMVNVAVRDWGHSYIWDYEELARRLGHVGFTDVRRFEIGESGTDELQGLETRADSGLIVEADPGKVTR